MNRTKLILLSALFIVGFIAPGATASWGSKGELEPNSEFDTSDVMWQNVPSASNQVYFSAFGGHWLVDANPNTAALGSGVSPTPTLRWVVAFGVWTDCNGDGYIGTAETAVQEYRSDLLLDDSDCARGVSPHNDGQWVYELLTIGRVDPCEHEPASVRSDSNHKCSGAPEFNPRPSVIYSESAKMWGDQGHPGQELTGSSCPIRPMPRGTFSNTGLMLRAADCLVGWKVGETLGFNDPKNAQKEDHPLVFNLPVSVFGNPQTETHPNGEGRTGLAEQDSGKPTATVWDCSGSSGFGTPAVSPTVADDPTDASVFDTVDGAYDGLTLLNQPVQDAVTAYNTQVRPVAHGATGHSTFKDDQVVEEIDCSTSTKSAIGAAYYDENLYGQDESGVGLLEGNNPPSNTNGKIENSFTYAFFEADLDPDNAEDKVILDLLGDGTPRDLGVTRARQLNGPHWQATTIYLSLPQTINRATLGPSGASYWSHYASINPTELGSLNLVAPGDASIYGAENCAEVGIGEGVTAPGLGWNCDPTAWYPDGRQHYRQGKNDDGTYNLDLVWDAVPGDLYQWRDVDCFDGTLVKGVPVRASLVDLSQSGPCGTSAPLPV